MIAEPITSLTINIILQYILPPSQLSQTLPTHLASVSLIKRHHFMNISPYDPLEYLCWPSPNRERAIELLEELSTHRNDDEGAVEHDVRYTSDVDYTYAHVRLEQDLRVIFQWDGEEGWKYHDTNIMPFPPGSQPSLHDVLAEAVTKATEGQGSRPSSLHRYSLGVDDSDENDDDSYWNAYGAQDDEGGPKIYEPVPQTADASEDAYWAQYSSVQGSGDSTVPSPSPTGRRGFQPPPHLRDQPATPPTPDWDQNQRPLPVPIRGHDQQSNLAPPSPKTLTQRLKSISPRGSPAGTRPSSRGPGTPTEPSPLSTLHSLDGETEDGSSTAVISPQSSPQESNEICPSSVADDEITLRESIRSVYRLWKMSRRTDGGEADKEIFMRVAKEVIELP